MAKFKLSKAYTMPDDEVREAALGLARSLEREHGVKSNWKGDSVSIRGAGVDGEMRFGGGVIDVSVKMGMLTSMFASALKKEMQSYLDEYVS